MSARFQFRRGTSDNIDSVAPVPAAGEPIYNTETNTLRVGDGSAAAGDLAPLANASITGDALLASAANSSSEITLFTHVFSPGDLLVGDLVNMDANGVAVNSSGSARTITLRGELTDGTSTVNLIPEQTVDIANLNFLPEKANFLLLTLDFGHQLLPAGSMGPVD